MSEQNLSVSEILDNLDTGQELIDYNIIKKEGELDVKECNAKSKQGNLPPILTSHSRIYK